MYICIAGIDLYCSVLESTSDTLKKSPFMNAEESNETELAM